MTNERILFRLRVSAECCFFARPACDRGSSGDRVSCVLSSGRAPQSLLLLPRRLARASSHECARHEGSDVDPQISSPWLARRAHSVTAHRVVGSTRVALRALGCAIGCFISVGRAHTLSYDITSRRFFIRPFVAVRSLIPTRASPLSPPRDVSPAASRLAGSTRLESKKPPNLVRS